MENIKELTKCSICVDTFIDPKVLPCVHTFCLKCLESCDKAQPPETKLACPLCRCEWTIPEGGVACLPTNYFVQKILEIEHITAVNSKQILCESCEKEERSDDEGEASVSEASVYCLDCQQHFFRQCHKAHGKMRFNKSHKVIKPGSLESDGLMKMTLSFCDKHTDEPVKHYCLDCQLVICLSCYVEDHSTHKCSSIGKEAEQARSQMREDMMSVVEQSKKLLKVSNDLKIENKTLLDEIADKTDAVFKRLADVNKINDEHAKELESKLNSIKQLKMKELETAKEVNERHQLMVDSYTRYVKEVVDQATDAELLRCATTMKTRAVDLKALHTGSDFSAVKVEFSTRSGFVGDVTATKSNSFGEFYLYI